MNEELNDAGKIATYPVVGDVVVMMAGHVRYVVDGFRGGQYGCSQQAVVRVRRTCVFRTSPHERSWVLELDLMAWSDLVKFGAARVELSPFRQFHESPGFVCPECGGNRWGTSGDLRTTDARGYCQGRRDSEASANIPGCGFSWNRLCEDDKYLGENEHVDET